MDMSIIKGFWWKPETPEKKAFGIIEQKGSKAVLTVYTDRKEYGFDGLAAGATIHGTNEQGKPVTLLLVTCVHTSTPYGLITTKIEPGYILFGAHVSNKSSFKSKTLTLQLQHLYGWLGLSGFSRQSGVNPFMPFNITYSRPEDVCFQIDDNSTVTFGMETNYSADFQAKGVKEDAYISFERDSGFDLQECFDLARSFSLLLHLSSLKKVYPSCMTLSGVIEHETLEGENTNDVKVWASHFREQTTILPIDGLWVFRFNDLVTGFGDFFAKWRAFEIRYSEALKCYSTSVYHSLPSTVENLCLTQAIDAYHGARFSSHGKRGFKDKVKELCDLNRDTLTWLAYDMDEFAGMVKDTRDYYTHHNPDDLNTRSVVQGAPELIRLNEKIKILFQTCILSDNMIPAARFDRLRRQMASEIVEFQCIHEMQPLGGGIYCYHSTLNNGSGWSIPGSSCLT